MPYDINQQEIYKQQRKELVRRMVEYHHQHYEMPTRRIYANNDSVTAYSEFMDQWMR